jgi:16S rRNA processing protein RimM
MATKMATTPRAAVETTATATPHLVMGRIAAPFGVRGWVRATPWSEDPHALLAHRTWALRRADGDGWVSVEVTDAKAQGRGLVAKLRGVETRDEASALRGHEIGVPREAAAAPKEGEVYWSDLVGLDVVNREGVALGRITDVVAYGAHPVLHVTADATTRLVPYVPAYVDRVDVVARRVVVDWQPEY